MPLYRLGSSQPTVDSSAWVAPNAVICGDVHVGANATIWWSTVIRGESDKIVIGSDSNVQDGSVLHTDPGILLSVGVGVTVGHNVILHGCTIGDYTMVGMGSVVMNKSVIGRESLIGAGALIPEGKSFPDRVLILGSPARVVRDLTDDEIAILHGSAAGYVAKGRRYASECQPI